MSAPTIARTEPPTGWSPLRISAPGIDESHLAIGLHRLDDPTASAASVLAFPGHDGLDLPAEEIGHGRVWLDRRKPSAGVERVTVRVLHAAATPMTMVHVWTTMDDEPYLLVASIPDAMWATAWPEVVSILGAWTGLGSDLEEVLR